MKWKIYLSAGALLGVVVIGALAWRGDDTPPQVVTTTSVLSSIVEDIAGNSIQAVSLVPAGSCPGHFDVKVQHLRLIEDSGMLLAHGFEEYLPDLQRSVSYPDFEPALVPIDVSWLTHAGIAALYEQVGEHLMNRFPDREDALRRELERALRVAEEQHLEVQALAADHDFPGRRVMCNDHLEGYLDYMGFDVVATYGPLEDLSPGGVRDIIRTGRSKGVELVVDNMQVGADTGRVFAEELDRPYVAVSNFPGVLEGADTLGATLRANAERIAVALKDNAAGNE